MRFWDLEKMAWKPSPVPPELLVEAEKRVGDKNKVREAAGVRYKEYYDKRDRVEAENRSNHKYLESMFKFFLEERPVDRYSQAVRKVLAVYEREGF